MYAHGNEGYSGSGYYSEPFDPRRPVDPRLQPVARPYPNAELAMMTQQPSDPGRPHPESPWLTKPVYAAVMRVTEQKVERILAQRAPYQQQQQQQLPGPPPAHLAPRTSYAPARPSSTAPTPSPPPAEMSVSLAEYVDAMAEIKGLKEKLANYERTNKARAAKQKERKRAAEAKKRAAIVIPDSTESTDTASGSGTSSAGPPSPYRDAVNSSATLVQLPDEAVLDAILRAGRSLSAIKAAVVAVRPGKAEKSADIWKACFPTTEMPSSKDAVLKDLAEFFIKNIGRLSAAKK
jgi:hypothetical protein